MPVPFARARRALVTLALAAPLAALPRALRADDLPKGAVAHLGQVGFVAPASAVAFSPDGKLLASVASEMVSQGTVVPWVFLWDASSGELVGKLEARRRYATSLAFSPDGRWLASGSQGDALLVWEVGTRRLAWRAQGELVAFSPDGSALAVSDGETICLRDPATGKVAHYIQGSEALCALAFAPDGKTIASSAGTLIRLHDLATGKLRASSEQKEGARDLAFSPDGKTLAVGSETKVLTLRDAATLVPRARLEGNERARWVAFSPDGKTLGSSFGDSSVGDRPVELWDVATRKVARAIGQTAHGRFAFSPDGKWIAMPDFGAPIRRFDVATGEPIGERPAHAREVGTIAWSSDGKTIATGSQDETIALWDVAGGKVRTRIGSQGAVVVALAFSPDGSSLASATDQLVALWDAASGARRQLWEQPQGYREGTPTRLAFSPDGAILASTHQANGLYNIAGHQESKLGIVELAQISGGPALHQLLHVDGLLALAFTPDGKELATCAKGERVARAWDPATGAQLPSVALETEAPPLPYRPGDGATFELAGDISIAGAKVAVLEPSGALRIHDRATGKLITTIAAGHYAQRVAFSPDGGKLVVWGDPARATFVVDASSGKPLASFSPASTVTAATFSPDGKTLATACSDATFYLWSVSP